MRSPRLTIGTVLVAGVLLCILRPVVLSQSLPSWWLETGAVITNRPPNDFGLANLGQAKWIAWNAAHVLDDNLTNGAGTALLTFVAGLSVSNGFSPLNVGQLKNLAKPFYDRLNEDGQLSAMPEGMPGTYPWTETTEDDNDFGAANVGQLKYVFSFDLDRNANGIADWWEPYLPSYEVPPPTGTDEDQDGLSDEWESTFGFDSPETASWGPAEIVGLTVFTPMEQTCAVP